MEKFQIRFGFAASAILLLAMCSCASGPDYTFIHVELEPLPPPSIPPGVNCRAISGPEVSGDLVRVIALATSGSPEVSKKEAREFAFAAIADFAAKDIETCYNGFSGSLPGTPAGVATLAYFVRSSINVPVSNAVDRAGVHSSGLFEHTFQIDAQRDVLLPWQFVTDSAGKFARQEISEDQLYQTLRERRDQLKALRTAPVEQAFIGEMLAKTQKFIYSDVQALADSYDQMYSRYRAIQMLENRMNALSQRGGESTQLQTEISSRRTITKKFDPMFAEMTAIFDSFAPSAVLDAHVLANPCPPAQRNFLYIEHGPPAELVILQLDGSGLRLVPLADYEQILGAAGVYWDQRKPIELRPAPTMIPAGWTSDRVQLFLLAGREGSLLYDTFNSILPLTFVSPERGLSFRDQNQMTRLIDVLRNKAAQGAIVDSLRLEYAVSNW
ncbi:MAG: hypothetical protein NUW37_04000 [Planctomycetes bacterium]|nr:hypothetical protein [Planctomycetota bacterium]